MDKRLESLQTALDTMAGRKTPPCVRFVRKRFEENEAEKLTLIEIAVERGKRAAKAEKHAEVIGEVVGHTRFLTADRKAQKKRRRDASRDNFAPRGKAGDEIDWDKYEVCRAIDNQLTKARKEKRRLTQLQAAERVKESYNKEIDRIAASPESLCTYYRRWKKRREKNRTD